MNEILLNTHRHEYINILKARDFYFDRARKINSIKNVLICIPSFLLLLSYVESFQKITVITNNRELFIGLLTMIVWIVNIFMKNFINKNKEISNILREEYDNKVFAIRENPFQYKKEKY